MRRRGLARAACSAALDAAIAAGHELVFIVADDEDWPKELYAKLGFDVVGRPWAFTRPGPEHPAHRP
jgi:predicted N-acetyltransferase YhbS